MARIFVAPDSFKGTIDAAAAAAAIAAGWRRVRPEDELLLLPQADGGEGTIAAIAAATPGARRIDAGTVTGPDGRPVAAHWVLAPDGTAIVELAVSSGLPLMATLDPLGATTRGLGEVIAMAIAAGASRLLVAVGGSGSTDGGTGALAALGARFLDADGRDLPDGGGSLGRLAAIDRSGLAPTPPMRVLTDVTAPLIGRSGAAAVFGPQKGASPEQVAILDAGLARLADAVGLLGRTSALQEDSSRHRARPEVARPRPVALVDATTPGGGAAGGTAYGLAALLGARIVPGAAAIAELTGLADALAEADLLITGEGRFDAQSSTGKVVGHAIEAARARGRRVAVVAGRIGDDAPIGDDGPDAIVSLTELAGDPESAIAEPARWLRAAGAGLATAFSA